MNKNITITKAQAISERLQSAKKSVNEWLNQPSEFFSAVCGGKETRKSGIRMHLFSGAAVVGLLCLNESPLLVGTAMVCAGYVVYRMTEGQIKDYFKNIEDE